MSRYLYPRLVLAVVVPCTLCLSGCGGTVPQLNEFWEPAAVSDQLVYRIKKSIYCELATAVEELDPQQTIHNGKVVHKLPDGWGAQMTITLQIDETGTLNPSLAFNDYLPNGIAPFVGKVAQSLTVPLGAQISSQATRIDNYYSYYSVDQLRKPISGFDTTCREYNAPTNQFVELNRNGSSLLLSGNLGIKSWLQGAIDAQSKIPSTALAPKSVSSKLDVLSYNIRFVVVTAGTVNPTWKLVSLSTGGGMPFVVGNRTRTHGLTLTLGPNDQALGGKSHGPSTAAANIHFNQDLQQTITNGFRSALSPLR